MLNICRPHATPTRPQNRPNASAICLKKRHWRKERPRARVEKALRLQLLELQTRNVHMLTASPSRSTQGQQRSQNLDQHLHMALPPGLHRANSHARPASARTLGHSAAKILQRRTEGARICREWTQLLRNLKSPLPSQGTKRLLAKSSWPRCACMGCSSETELSSIVLPRYLRQRKLGIRLTT